MVTVEVVVSTPYRQWHEKRKVTEVEAMTGKKENEEFWFVQKTVNYKPNRRIARKAKRAFDDIYMAEIEQLAME